MHSVSDLRDFALFLGDNSSVLVLASDFPGCKPNCIYFTHDDDGFRSCAQNIRNSGVYDLKAKKMIRFDSDVISIATASKRIPIWVLVPCDQQI